MKYTGTYSDIDEEDDKEMIASMETGGYSWSAFGLFKDEAGRLYVASDSGCSCNWAWSYPPDFEPVESVQEAIKQARAMLPEQGKQQYYYDYYSQSDVDGFVQEALNA